MRAKLLLTTGAFATLLLSSALAQPPRTPAPNPFGAPQPADIAAVASCIDKAQTRAALTACKTIVSEPCMSEDGSETTIGMVTCAMRSRGAWDAALNGVYQRLLRTESATQRRALRTAQTAWIAWRDAGCAYDASVFEGGSLARVIAASCLDDKTAERAIALIARERGPEFE